MEIEHGPDDVIREKLNVCLFEQTFIGIQRKWATPVTRYRNRKRSLPHRAEPKAPKIGGLVNPSAQIRIVGVRDDATGRQLAAVAIGIGQEV